MEKQLKTYSKNRRDYELLKADKEVLMKENNSVWDNFTFGFGRRL